MEVLILLIKIYVIIFIIALAIDLYRGTMTKK